ncbi:MAG: dephospho-CoA kinase [Alphaproteobacteria bacterium HGW-Alphaproteobacteria-2]|nr:MAG: dephospho-CoA kinase [Alphaproteobacteria bacterium HGW-Alphaproteobacteria-2]
MSVARPSRPFRLGLTGSIGMGKSTTAAYFREAGVPVWDADAAVHGLYAPGGEALAHVARLCPVAVGPLGVDRARLRAAIAADPALLPRIEAVVHPLVAADRAAFIARAAGAGVPLVVLDIPLLYETGAEQALDAVLVVTASASEQRRRVLARPGMTEADFAHILSRQLPDAEKCRRADHVIETRTPEQTRAAVHALIERLAPGAFATGAPKDA